MQHEKNVTMLEERIVHVKAQLEIKDTELNAQIKMQVCLSWDACCMLSVACCMVHVACCMLYIEMQLLHGRAHSAL